MISSGIRLEDLPDYYRRQAEEQIAAEDAKWASREKPKQATPASTWAPSMKHRAAPPRRGKMNATEAAYMVHLIAQGREWRFEGIKLRLATGAWFTPDFWSTDTHSQWTEIHEVKGFWREAARVRIKVAAKEYPMLRFFVAQKARLRNGGGWKMEEIRE